MEPPNVSRALCVYTVQAAAAASLPPVGANKSRGRGSGGGWIAVEGEGPAGVNTPSGVGARQETCCDLCSGG